MVSLPSEFKRFSVPHLQVLLLCLRHFISTTAPDAVSFRVVSCALRSSEDEKVDYHEGVYEHERYCEYVSCSVRVPCPCAVWQPCGS